MPSAVNSLDSSLEAATGVWADKIPLANIGRIQTHVIILLAFNGLKGFGYSTLIHESILNDKVIRFFLVSPLHFFAYDSDELIAYEY